MGIPAVQKTGIATLKEGSPGRHWLASTPTKRVEIELVSSEPLATVEPILLTETTKPSIGKPLRALSITAYREAMKTPRPKARRGFFIDTYV